MQFLPEPLAPLAAYRQFICYRLINRADGATDKLPVNPLTGEVCDAHDPSAWVDAETACGTSAAWGPGYGVAFVFTRDDPFFFIDIDKCATPTGWSETAQRVCAMFPGAAIEVSQSGKGLHLFGRGRVGEHRKKNTALGLEFYTEARFVALTGANALGTAASDHTAALAAFTAQYMAPGPGGEEALGWTTEPVAGWNGPTDDAKLIERAMRSQSAASAFGARASFADLWTANHDALARAYPSDTGPYDASSADAALAQHLAFWTGKNCERIYSLMMQSALKREKWERDDYLKELTIPNAVARQVDVLTDKLPEPPPTPAAASDAPMMEVASGSSFIGVEQQAEFFKGCVYVLDAHRVLIPGGRMLKPEQFRAMFGGYTYNMDDRNERVSRNAWEVFTESQALRAPKADTSCFKPDRAAAELIREAGRVSVNTYWPVEVPRKVGDPGPFLLHLSKVLPDPRDAQILLSYMAACVQHKGTKFQWAPFLQGVEGNGKTLFTRCVAEAVGRRYVHWPKAAKMTKEFNAWRVGKLFIGVEDIYTEDGRHDVWEQLKPMITAGDGYEIEAKGVDQVTVDLVDNFLINSNHKNGLRKTRNDRRIAPFYCGQQAAADLVRDGMTGDYFPRLYDWLRAEGYAIVSELLYTMPIPPEFNPATQCQRAPVTSSTEAAIVAGMGSVEQEIQEAIETGLPGFAGGWISSIALDGLLERERFARVIPRNKRRELLQALGYDWHPGLTDGRVNNLVMPDGGKPRLFITAAHPARGLVGAGEIARAYTEAQKPTVSAGT